MQIVTVDIWLRKKRNTQAAYAFLKELFNHFGEPKVLVTDKHRRFLSFPKVAESWVLSTYEHRTVKYLNNLIWFQIIDQSKTNNSIETRTAATTIKRMETIRGLYKKSRKEGSFWFSGVSLKSRGLYKASGLIDNLRKLSLARDALQQNLHSIPNLYACAIRN